MRSNLIIIFHAIKDPIWFEGVILLLKANYRLLDLGFFENSNNYREKKGFCHVTFDDGDKTFHNVVYPILKKHDVPATIFVSPKIAIKQENFWFQEVENYDKDAMARILSRELALPLRRISVVPFTDILKNLSLDMINNMIRRYQEETNTAPKACQNMTLDEILEVEKSELITVGAHTLNHPILKNESDEMCYNEITGSIVELEKLLGHEVRYFAYPNGTPNIDFGEREINYLKKNNIAIAVSTEGKLISEHDDKLALPRMGLSHGSMPFIKSKLILGANWERIKVLVGRSELKSRENVACIMRKQSGK